MIMLLPTLNSIPHLALNGQSSFLETLWFYGSEHRGK